MINSFFKSKKWFWWAWGGLVLLVTSLWVQVQIIVAINSWYKGFYDLLQKAGDYTTNPQEGIGLFYDNLISLDYFSGGEVSFIVLALPYALLVSITQWFTRAYAMRWREATTFYYLAIWKATANKIEGASQRVQEDCEKFTRKVETIGLHVVKAVLTLAAFIPILWELSDQVVVPFLSDIPGSLVWTAIVVSIGGLAISWFVGIRLPGLEYNNQKVEAAFRKQLVLGEDDKKKYLDNETLWELFTGIRYNYKRLFLHYGYFDIWMSSYDQFMVIVPYLIMGSGLFTNTITLGIMIQVSNAFQKVHGGFALFLHRWTDITELRSVWKRLHEFELLARI